MGDSFCVKLEAPDADGGWRFDELTGKTAITLHATIAMKQLPDYKDGDHCSIRVEAFLHLGDGEFCFKGSSLDNSVFIAPCSLDSLHEGKHILLLFEGITSQTSFSEGNRVRITLSIALSNQYEEKTFTYSSTGEWVLDEE